MVWPRRLLSVDAMTFWVFERRSMSGAWALADNIDPVYGEAPRCPGCGNLIGMKPWLPQDRTEWEYGETTGKPIRIVRYAFHKDRMSESSIFKIPETPAGRSSATTAREVQKMSSSPTWRATASLALSS